MSEMKTIIAPSLLAADASRWGEEIGLLGEEGISCLHLDIMDGRFVPNITFGPGQVGMMRKCGDMEYDAHLMIVEPESLIAEFAKAGADSVTVHQEACVHLHRVLQMIRELGLKAGVAINPSTPVVMLEPVLPFLDRALVMTVNPGFGGQKAILSVLKKVEWLKQEKEKEGFSFEIQVDGGVDRGNVRQFLEAGAENLVIGSALFQPGKTRVNIEAFRELISDFEDA